MLNCRLRPLRADLSWEPWTVGMIQQTERNIGIPNGLSMGYGEDGNARVMLGDGRACAQHGRHDDVAVRQVATPLRRHRRRG